MKRLRVAHIAMQFNDTDQQHTSDIEKVFHREKMRKCAWIAGTEAGPGSGNTGEELVQVAKANGYVPWVPAEMAKGHGRASGQWIAVRKDLIVPGTYDKGFISAIPGSQELYQKEGLDPDLNPRWGPRGLVWVKFEIAGLGEFNVGCGHYITKGRNPGAQSVFHGIDHYKWNNVLAKTIGDWAEEVGKGSALAFYSGDQNKLDNKNSEKQGDTFNGAPLTSTWDELKKYESTGHGPIDVLATYNRDGRVKALTTRALDDREFPLATDHYLLEGEYGIQELQPKHRA